MFYLSEAEELLETVWSVYGHKDLSDKKFHIKFQEDGIAVSYKFKRNFDYNERSKEITQFKWMMQDTGTIELVDEKSGQEYVFTKDTTVGHTTYHAAEAGLTMYLISAPKSRRFGYEEPRTYMDVTWANNFSQINAEGCANAKEGVMVQTNFSKVRIIMSKNTSGKFNDKIDCTDFTFANTNGDSFYCLDPEETEEQKDVHGIFDVSCYAAAQTMSSDSWAKVSIDLSATPFKIGSSF